VATLTGVAAARPAGRPEEGAQPHLHQPQRSRQLGSPVNLRPTRLNRLIVGRDAGRMRMGFSPPVVSEPVFPAQGKAGGCYPPARGRHPRIACQENSTMLSIAYVTPSMDSAADERSLGAEAHPGLGPPRRGGQ
jgi:hypothetical protein